MKITYIGARPREVVPATGGRAFTIRPGDTIDVADDMGESLLAQPRWWKVAAEAKASTGKDE